MSKRKKRPARKRAPLNLRAGIDPKRPDTWTDPPKRPPVTPDPIEMMYARDSITGAERNAAYEIAKVFRMVSAGLFAKAASMGTVRGETPMLDRLVDARTSRYKPWADVLSRQRTLYGDPTLEIVIEAVVEGVTCRELDRRFKWRNGNASLCLRNGLRLYAFMAGWQQGKDFYDKEVA